MTVNITTRLEKGSALSQSEMDKNLTDLEQIANQNETSITDLESRTSALEGWHSYSKFSGSSTDTVNYTSLRFYGGLKIQIRADAVRALYEGTTAGHTTVMQVIGGGAVNIYDVQNASYGRTVAADTTATYKVFALNDANDELASAEFTVITNATGTELKCVGAVYK